MEVGMEEMNVLSVTTREEFRAWLSSHHDAESECWVVARKGRAVPEGCLWYIDAVEEALCFGWIDTTHKSINGVDTQKFTPRSRRSPWSELNKERVRRLEKLGLMTPSGRAALPDMEGFVIDHDIRKAFEEKPKAWSFFSSCPPLYQRVRIDCTQRDKGKDRAVFDKRLEKLIMRSVAGEMYGDWNDYGRLLSY